MGGERGGRARERLAAVQDRLTSGGFGLAWAGACRLPEPVAYRLFDLIADGTYRRGGADVERLRANYARVRPELSPAQLEPLVREGLRSYMRYWCEAFRLPTLSPERIMTGVRAVGDEPVRERLAAGGSVVCFLGHLGNWDSAGAWASRDLAPVTTVAERLEPEELFARFLAFREGLGMTILPLTGGGPVFETLRERARAGGALIPLLADRDLTSTGVEVDFVGRRARMAAGPAALALATGAALHPVTMHYERHVGGPGGYRLVVTFAPAVEVPELSGGDAADPQVLRTRTAAMTQACADALAEGITAHTADWHMMQRVFVEDLDPARLPAPQLSTPRADAAIAPSGQD